VTFVIAVVAVVVALASYLTLLASRLDRLAIRVEAAEAALDAQLARRAIAAYDLSAGAGHAPLHQAARAALDGASESTSETGSSDEPVLRGERESALSRALRDAPEVSAVPEMAVAARKVMLARQFYNDAVRDLLALRRQPIVRVLHLYGRAKAPAYAEFDADEPGG
jgi:hypothetical protein